MPRKTQRLEDLPSLTDLPPDGLLTVEETAAYLGIAPSTLEKWRFRIRGTEGGPPYCRLEGGPKAPVRYLVSDVRTWIADHRTDPKTTAVTATHAA